MRSYGLFLLTASLAFAQSDRVIHFGVKIGTPVTEAFSSASTGDAGCGTTAQFIPCTETGYASKTKRLLVGPSVEVRVFRHLTFEADALDHRLAYDSWQIDETPSSGLTEYYSSAAASDWEFPLLAKYRLSASRIRPFVVGGIAINHISGFRQATDIGYRDFSNDTGVNHGVTNHSFELNEPTSIAFDIGLGLELHLSRLRISPEIRYLRWNKENFLSGPDRLFHSNRNQVQILLGVTF